LGKTTYRLGITLTVLGGDVLGATVSIRAQYELLSLRTSGLTVQEALTKESHCVGPALQPIPLTRSSR
jgi:hypothetical protein